LKLPAFLLENQGFFINFSLKNGLISQLHEKRNSSNKGLEIGNLTQRKKELKVN